MRWKRRLHRLVSAGLLPERAGQPARVWAHISLADLMVQLAKHGRGTVAPSDPGAPTPGTPATQDPYTPQALQVLLSSPAGLTRETLERLIIGRAVALVSGPGGLASFLRREQLGARLAGPSLPLDVGYSDDVPAAICNAVKLRDKFCQWAGGCFL